MNRKKIVRLSTFLVLSFFLTSVLFVYTSLSEAVPAMPGVRTHVQQDGSLIHYQVHGDEFLTYSTNQDGDLVAFGQDGDMYLARWASEGEPDYPAVIPTATKSPGVLPGGDTPELEEMETLETEIPSHHLGRARQMRNDRDKRWRQQSKSSTSPISPRSRSTGFEANVVLIYVSFTDYYGTSLNGVALPSDDELYNWYFNEAVEGSVAHYYNTVTAGGARVLPATTNNAQRDGVIKVTLPGRHPNLGAHDTAIWAQLVIPAIKQAANTSNPGGYIDYKYFDDLGNGDGILEPKELSIGIVVHAYDFEDSIPNTEPKVSAYSWDFSPPEKINGVDVWSYFFHSAFRSYPGTDLKMPVGVVAHEMGHNAFGFMIINLSQEKENCYSISNLFDMRCIKCNRNP